MRVAYDAQVDALCMVLAEAEVMSSRELADGLIVNLDREGRLVSVEVLQASKRIGLTFKPSRKGTFEIGCHVISGGVGSHYTAGMKGSLTVK